MTHLLIIYYDETYISFLELKNKCGRNFDVLVRVKGKRNKNEREIKPDRREEREYDELYFF